MNARRRLADSVVACLYDFFYKCGGPRPIFHQGSGLPTSQSYPDPDFLAQLRGANSGVGHWQGGWTLVEYRANGQALARRGAITVHVDASEWRQPRPAEPDIEVAVPNGLEHSIPGFYLAVGDLPLDDEHNRPLLRFYWNLTPDGAINCMRAASLGLNRARVPFQLKILVDPTRFDRCDPVVLYLPYGRYPGVRQFIKDLAHQLAQHLRMGTPALTKRLIDGVAVAEDPGYGQSFGLHRCALLAECALRALDEGVRREEDRLALATRMFNEAGVSLDAPYLQPGSPDRYRELAAVSIPAPVPGPGDLGGDSEDPIEWAGALGRGLVRTAIWHDSACTWVGMISSAHTFGGREGSHHASLGPDVYDGTAGIALFLAELYGATGVREARDAALGALRHSFAKLSHLPLRWQPSLYLGWPGIALVAVRVAALTGAEWPLHKAVQLASSDEFFDCSAEIGYDMLSGKAGTAAALVALARIFGEDGPASVVPGSTGLADRLMERSTSMGHEIIAGARRHDAGLSWFSESVQAYRDLTGFAHGASGIAYALLKLHAATGQVAFAKAAELALAYERRWFYQESGAWGDFRRYPGHRSDRPFRRQVAHYWCHGSAGIALVRLLAYELFGDEQYRDEATAALRATRNDLLNVLDRRRASVELALCHGGAGQADVLLEGARFLAGTRLNDELDQTCRQWSTLVAARRESDYGWHLGVKARKGMMLGIAGVGHTILRQHRPGVSSPLALDAVAG